MYETDEFQNIATITQDTVGQDTSELHPMYGYGWAFIPT
jgi:hypothetical protein